MYLPEHFAVHDQQQIARFVADAGAADFVTFDGSGLVASLLPVIWDRSGGEHGSSLTGSKDYGIDSGAFRSLWIDAGHPKGVAAKTPIARCAPYLFLIKSG